MALTEFPFLMGRAVGGQRSWLAPAGRHQSPAAATQGRNQRWAIAMRFADLGLGRRAFTGDPRMRHCRNSDCGSRTSAVNGGWRQVKKRAYAFGQRRLSA